MKFSYVTMRVRNLAVTQKFYEEIFAFVEVKRLKPRPGMEIVFLNKNGATGIELIEEETFTEKQSNINLTFDTENMIELIDMLKEKDVQIVAGPIPIGNGGEMMIINDPDKVQIGFITNPE